MENIIQKVSGLHYVLRDIKRNLSYAMHFIYTHIDIKSFVII